MPSSDPVSQEMIHPTALEPIKNKEMNAPKVGVGVSPPPTPPSKDDEDIKKGAQPSSQDFNPLTADTDSVHNDSHAKSVESVEPGASTHEPKPLVLQHDDKVESTKATSSSTPQEEPTSEQDKPTPYIVPEATPSPPQVKGLEEEAPKPGPSTEKNEQDDTIEQAASTATGPTAAAPATPVASDHDGTTTANGNKQANGNKENAQGATKKLKREISKKKPLFGFLKKACDDDLI